MRIVALAGLTYVVACKAFEPGVVDRVESSAAVVASPPLLNPASGGADFVDRPNVLVVLLDDVGQDKLLAWEPTAKAPPTPTIDGLVHTGLLFHNAYAAPVCQAGRMALLTGRWGRRTGVGSNTNPGEEGWVARDDEGTVAHVLAHGGWSTALVGKWHLATYDTVDPLADAARRGFSRWQGTFANLYDTVGNHPGLGTYYAWEKIDDGEFYPVYEYVTSVQVDDVLDKSESLPEPWFLMWAPNAAHDPWMAPPPDLLDSTAAQATVQAYDDTLAAFDVELGRLLAGLDPDRRSHTLIVLAADNGTPKKAMVAPFDPSRAKATIYDGGTLVPMVWNGPGVAVGETDALVHLVDVLPTLANWLGLEASWSPFGPQIIDGRSFARTLSDPGAPARDVVFQEYFLPNGDAFASDLDLVAVRNPDHKLIRDIQTGEELFFAYESGVPGEGPNLMLVGLTAAQETVRAQLGAEVDAFVQGVLWAGP